MGGWVAGWVAGSAENKAQLSSNAIAVEVEIEAEVGNDVRATKRILYDMVNFLDINRPSYGLYLFYFR